MTTIQRLKYSSASFLIMDVEVDDLDRIEKLEAVASSRFLGLVPEYHKRMGEALVHALANWVPKEHIEDALSDIQYYSDKVLRELETDIHCSRFATSNHKG
jgi:hypothetical protein